MEMPMFDYRHEMIRELHDPYYYDRPPQSIEERLMYDFRMLHRRINEIEDSYGLENRFEIVDLKSIKDKMERDTKKWWNIQKDI